MKYLLFILFPFLIFAQVTEKKFGDIRVKEIIPVISSGSTFTDAVTSTLPDSIIYTTELGDTASAIRGDFPSADTTHYVAFNSVIGLQDSINAGGDTTHYVAFNSVIGLSDSIAAGGDSTHFTTIAKVIALQDSLDDKLNRGDSTLYATQSDLNDIQTISDSVYEEDLRTPVSAIRLPAANPPTVTAYYGGSVLEFPTAADAKIFFEFQMPHGRDPDSQIDIHIHYALSADASAGDTVRWVLTYSWTNISGTMVAPTTVNYTSTLTDKIDSTHYYEDIVHVSGTGKTLSSVLLCSMMRDVSEDAYAGSVYLMTLDAHYSKKDIVGVGSVLFDTTSIYAAIALKDDSVHFHPQSNVLNLQDSLNIMLAISDSTIYLTPADANVAYQPLDADLTDLADGSLTASKVAGVVDADYGDITVSSGSWAVEDDSHNHIISNVDNLQDSLNAANAYIDSNYVLYSEMDLAPNLIQDSLTVKLNRSELDLAPSLIQDSLTVKLNRSEMDLAPGLIQDSLTVKANTSWFAIAPALLDDSITVKLNRSEYSPGGVSDGDKTDIDVSGSGTVWNIDTNAVGMNELDETAFSTRGHIWGLTLSNNGSDASNDIDIAVGEATNDSTYDNLILAGALTKRLDAGWAVGTNQGGLNTGSEGASTWYEVHLIRRTDTGVVDVMFTTTANRATLPAGYTQQRRIGWIYNDGSSNIKAFTQRGNYFLWTTQVNDASATMTESATAVTLSAPPFTIARFRGVAVSTTSVNETAVIVFSERDEGNVTPASTTGISSLGVEDMASVDAAHFELRVDASSQIEWDTDNTVATFDISTYGYIDERCQYGDY